ncbi:MAG: MFS transporter [Hyphomicrobiaceae bacterium]
MTTSASGGSDPGITPAAQRLAFWGWLTGALFFFYAWVLRVTPSVMVDDLMRDLSVGAGAIGGLSAFYFYSYAGLQLPIGMLIDRYGPRRLMTLAGLGCAVGCALFAFSTSLWALSAARFLIGAAAGFSLVGAMAVAGQWFPPARFALLSGFAMMLGMAGGVFGQAPMRLAVEASDWRTAMLVTGAGGIVIAVAAWATVRDRRRGPRGLGSVFTGLGHVARNPQTWLLAVAGLGSTGPLLGFAGLWGVPYLVTTQGLSQSQAAGITSFVFIGWGVGAPVFGWLSDRIKLRRPPFVCGLLLSAAALATLVLAPGLTPAAIAGLCFLSGFGGSAQIVGFAATREHNPTRFSGTAIGLVNGMMTGGGALYQPLVGWLLDLGWNGQLAGGARVYDAETYRMAFLVLIAGTVIAAICAFLLRETRCQSLEERQAASGSLSAPDKPVAIR